MKNRLEGRIKPRLRTLTIELPPEQFDGINRMADLLGATPKQVVEALIADVPEDYLKRQSDNIWGSLVYHLTEVYGSTPRLRLWERYLAAVDANSDLPSIAERQVLWERGDGVLSNINAYQTYLADLGADEQDFDTAVAAR